MYDVILQLTYEQLIVQQVKTPKLRAARIKGFYSTCQAIRWELRGYKRKILRIWALYLGWSRRTGDKQSRMAPTCGPVYPSGCGM